MKMRAGLLAGLWVALSVWTAQAARIEVSTGDPVEVRIAVGVPTVISFPEGIKGVTTSADPNAVSLEVEGDRLFVQSLRDGFGAVLFVTGQSGKLHIVNLVEDVEPDTVVQLMVPQERVQAKEFPQGAPRPAGMGRRPQGNPMRRLLVAMLKGQRLPGIEVLEHSQPLASSDEVEIRTTHVYTAGRYLGFLGVAWNLTDVPFVLRLPEYQAPGLKAIAADLETIPAAGETRVYLVVEPGSPY